MRAPATRDQADAYRFGLRRMEAALVRGDPVPLHEQIRAQRRAALGGVVLGLLGLVVAGVIGKLAPRPNWAEHEIVVGSSTGTMYAVARQPDRLVPVANLAAARLVVAALGGRDAAGAEPVAVPDDALATAPRTPPAATPGAPDVQPSAPGVAPRWAVCDSVTAEGSLAGTTVVGAGEFAGGTDAAVLLAGPDGATWLVTAGRRHRVDTADGAVLAAFRLARLVPRAASTALVSTLPEGAPLATPQVDGRGTPAPGAMPGVVGDLVVTRPVSGPPQHFVVLRTGLQEVPAAVAELLRVAGGSEPAPIAPDVLASAPAARELPVDGWPEAPALVVEPPDGSVACWSWQAGGPPEGGVWVGPELPIPAGRVPVQLAGADGPGPRLDTAAVGAGGPVRATAPGRPPGAGPLWLLAPGGVAYGVADAASAAALGVGPAEPAPEAALRLLPTGAVLDVAAAGQVVEVPPPGPR